MVNHGLLHQAEPTYQAVLKAIDEEWEPFVSNGEMSRGTHLLRQRPRSTVEPWGKIGVVRTQSVPSDSNSSSVQRVGFGMLALEGE